MPHPHALRPPVLSVLAAGVALVATNPVAGAAAPAPRNLPVETIASFNDARPGNPAVGADGRLFVSMSALSNPDVNLQEIVEGVPRPFPDERWSRAPEGASIEGIAATIGIAVTSEGTLWSLDMGSTATSPPQPPKLVAWDRDGQLVRVIVFAAPVLREHSFLQDLVIDETRHRAIVADMTFDPTSGLSDYPAFIVVDLDTGMMRRVLERHASVLPSGESIVIDGRPVAHAGPDGEPVAHRYGLNPIAITPDDEWIYYGAMGARTLYRIPAEAIGDASLTRSRLEATIERYADKPHGDGIAVDAEGNVFVTDVERHAVGVCRPEGCATIALDPETLSWPDGLALAPDGSLIVVANALHELPGLNAGKDASSPPYRVVRIDLSGRR